jgi:hypothetical protein
MAIKFRPWPIHLFDVQTALTADEVVKILQANCGPRTWKWPFEANTKYFSGDITDNDFQLRRIISYKNSYLPEITGAILPGAKGIRVSITMKLNKYVVLFMAIWLSMVALFEIAAATSIIVGGKRDLPLVLIPFGLLIFGLLLPSVGFWFEAKAQEAKLRSLLSLPKP